MVLSQAVSWAFWARPGLQAKSLRVSFHVLRRAFILSSAEAPEDPVQGGEYHASPPVGLQVPLVVLVVSLPEDAGAAEEEERGGESTGVEETAADVMTGEGDTAAAAAVVVGTAG